METERFKKYWKRVLDRKLDLTGYPFKDSGGKISPFFSLIVLTQMIRVWNLPVFDSNVDQ